MTEYSTEGCSYGSVRMEGKEMKMSSVVSKKPLFDLQLDNVALCVVPVNNRDDLEVQFVEHSDRKAEDSLVQMTLHFPAEEDEETGDSAAQLFHQKMMDTGFSNSVTGNIIAEFSKEQGNFVYPRGKYSIQMTSTLFHMQGAQYAYKILYRDIKQLYLLPKFEKAPVQPFVIALNKPIRKGNNKFHNLVLESHRTEHTMKLNLSEEECVSLYEGQLSPVITKPIAHLFGLIFKILSQRKVVTRKKGDNGFNSNRNEWGVKCSLKTSEGWLFPLAKSLIFINQPCFIIAYEDIDSVEFNRFEPAANAATRNFDLVVHIKPDAHKRDTGAEAAIKKYEFFSIDRSEYYPLTDFLKSKRLDVKEPVSAAQGRAGRAAGQEDGLLDMLGEEADSANEDSEDGDYQSGQSSDSAKDSDDNDDSDSDGDGEAAADEEGRGGSDKKRRKDKKPAKKKRGKKDDGKEEQKKKKRKKDPNAPKGALSAYILFSSAERPKIVADNPGIAVTEVSKLIGARWKLIDADTKAEFEEKARLDKVRYQEQMEEYRKSGGGGDEDDGDD